MMVTTPQDLQDVKWTGHNKGHLCFNKNNLTWTTKPIVIDMFFPQQVKHPKWKNKFAGGVKHSKIHQGDPLDMNINVVNTIFTTSLLHIKKKENSRLRMRLDVLLATWRKIMLLGINHDKNKSKLPKLTVRTNNLLLVLNRSNNKSKLPKLVVQTKFHHQTRHLNNRKSNATINKKDMRARMMKMAATIMATVETGTAMRKKLLASSSSPCPSSPVPMIPKNTSHGNSRLTRSSACTTLATKR